MVTRRDSVDDVQLLVIASDNTREGNSTVHCPRMAGRDCTVVDWAGAVERIMVKRPTAVCVPAPATDSDREMLHAWRVKCASIPIIGYANTNAGRNMLLREGLAHITVRASDVENLPAVDLVQQAEFFRRHETDSADGMEFLVGNDLRHSRMIGSMLTTASGVVQRANTCIAKWLGYPNASYLVGVNVAERHMKKSTDWSTLAKAAGDKKPHVCADVSASDVDARWHALRVEASVVPECSSLLRLLLLDDTQQQLYKATAEIAFKKASEGQGAGR